VEHSYYYAGLCNYVSTHQRAALLVVPRGLRGSVTDIYIYIYIYIYMHGRRPT
jgi:hypothetical protein